MGGEMVAFAGIVVKVLKAYAEKGRAGDRNLSDCDMI